MKNKSLTGFTLSYPLKRKDYICKEQYKWNQEHNP